MLLNVLLTKHCNAKCYFCIENTKVATRNTCSANQLIDNINQLILYGIVDDILLLGGEPLLYPYIQQVVENVILPCIITTNGTHLPINFPWSKLRALNVSIPHYDQLSRTQLMRVASPTNASWATQLARISIPKRMNTLLLRTGIHDMVGIQRMIELARQLTFSELKFGELTGYKSEIYDFIAPETVMYNARNYTPIPIREMHEVCHRVGGTHYWQTIEGIKVYFNASPDNALRGGYNALGQRYHIVLFNDGKLGWSWRRADGVYDVDEFINLYKSQIGQ